MSDLEPKTLVLRETGVTTLRDGTTAVNVGPIIAALRFLTEGRGEDRGTDELGHPLPDLMSLAFDVVQSIILGGRKAEYFRRVKQELDAFSEASGQSSLKLAKRAERVERREATEATALDDAADELKSLLARVSHVSLDEASARDVQQALDGFRDFGADRWVSATAQLLIAARALAPTLVAEREATPSVARKRAPRKKMRKKPLAAASESPAPKARKRSKSSTSKKPVPRAQAVSKKKRPRHA